MELDDVITLATPEGVELELTLAGAGSRMIAGAIDLIAQGVLVVALLVGLLSLGAVGLALFSIAAFLVLFAYDVLFEVLGGGQTPGKRITGLRVVRSDGSPVDLRASAVRNIARLVDGPPFSYLPTLIGILVTKNNQRPGDLAGDTVVIRATRARPPRRGRRGAEPAHRRPAPPPRLTGMSAGSPRRSWQSFAGSSPAATPSPPRPGRHSR